ncbi:Myb-like_DNA-binding domain-containing protein [Hexamita inflata]|uniref:Myb-like DNA-binding domain-containing protein n=1 Tax=Hexamita inflata TaxID=28002 RepID=A0AA86Q4K8_9EUKA|nr:Myb-like DNA-binding domain-containing protein [Hexamita inflata]CAI9949327.1 Myb-like DNA-binding domain-containing protein [Hexamita inflata]CAI9965370.1 Myb-like DNA-binding domain-containing protein [Hexamita inflata]
MQNTDQQEKVYQLWNESEINRLIDAVDASYNYKTNKIDWQNVLKIFPDRTLSQCKSFYFNQVKPYIFKPGGELTKENIKFTLTCYYYFITEKMPGDYETYDLRVQRILADQCWSDLVKSFSPRNYVSQQECTIKTMRGARYMVNYHHEHKQEIEDLLKKHGKINRMGFIITPDNWQRFLKKLDNQQFWDILKEVEVTLKTMNI